MTNKNVPIMVSLLLGHGPFGLEVTLIFNGSKTWDTKASLKIKITQPI